jgi:glycosyl hydrolase family 71
VRAERASRLRLARPLRRSVSPGDCPSSGIQGAVPANDYYNRNYLSKTGESGKWVAQGGYLRQRPLGRTPTYNAAWLQLNMEAEIRAAMARGITGFAFDVLSAGEATGSNSPLQRLLAAALAVDSRFKIMVMPDIAALQGNSSAVVEIIAAVASSPTAYRLSDGRLVSSAFDADLNSAAWWSSVFSQLKAKGIEVAFVPVFLGWQGSVESFAPISYGISDWGTATAASASAMQPDPGIVHSVYGKKFMMPIDPQQFRPKDFLYWEAGHARLDLPLLTKVRVVSKHRPA